MEKNTPETLKPEQMESGKWYVVNATYQWILKLKEIDDGWVLVYNAKRTDGDDDFRKDSCLTTTDAINSVRTATKEEVLKYFPDEVFEPKVESWKADVSKEAIHFKPENVSLINEVNNSQVTEQQNEKWSEKIDEIIDTHVVQKLKPEHIELRPEDLKAGEVYKATDNEFKWVFKFSNLEPNCVNHRECAQIGSTNVWSKGYFSIISTKFYHATPEEKKLLLGEEQTDWEAKYNELKVENDSLKVYYRVLNEKHIELKERINQTETKNNQEKVYIAMNNMLQYSIGELDIVKSLAREGSTIYEAICIGKKKSVLVSE